MVLGSMLLVGSASPSMMRSAIAGRLIAWFMAVRTLRSRSGFFSSTAPDLSVT